MRLLPRPDPSGETCPQCHNYDTLITRNSWNTPMYDGTIRCVDEIACFNCGLGIYVGWVTVNPDWQVSRAEIFK